MLPFLAICLTFCIKVINHCGRAVVFRPIDKVASLRTAVLDVMSQDINTATRSV